WRDGRPRAGAGSRTEAAAATTALRRDGFLRGRQDPLGPAGVLLCGRMQAVGDELVRRVPRGGRDVDEGRPVATRDAARGPVERVDLPRDALRIPAFLPREPGDAPVRNGNDDDPSRF